MRKEITEMNLGRRLTGALIATFFLIAPATAVWADEPPPPHGGGGGAHGLLQLGPSLQGGFVKLADNRPENIARAGDSFGPALAFG